MDGHTGMIILWIVIGFFGLLAISCGIVIYIVWQRRKMTVTMHLDDTGQWNTTFWHPDELDKEFTYREKTYKFDIKKCTRDKWNRPVAKYYIGNPEPMLFKYESMHKTLNIGHTEITTGDFKQLMLSKVLKDIFSDDEVMNWLMIIFFTVLGVGVIIIILLFARNPPCELSSSNETIAIISEGVKQAIKGGVAT